MKPLLLQDALPPSIPLSLVFTSPHASLCFPHLTSEPIFHDFQKAFEISLPLHPQTKTASSLSHTAARSVCFIFHKAVSRDRGVCFCFMWRPHSCWGCFSLSPHRMKTCNQMGSKHPASDLTCPRLAQYQPQKKKKNKNKTLMIRDDLTKDWLLNL